MSFFMIHRQDLTIFFHPLSGHAREDHIGRSAFFGDPIRLHLNVLRDDGDPPQYTELKLGYSAESGLRPRDPHRRSTRKGATNNGQWWLNDA